MTYSENPTEWQRQYRRRKPSHYRSYYQRNRTTILARLRAKRAQLREAAHGRT